MPSRAGSRKEETIVSSFFFCYNIKKTKEQEEDMVSALLKKMTRVFSILCGPAALFFIIIFFLHRQEIAVTPPFWSRWTWGVVLLVLSVTFGIALPILMRTLFHSRTVRDKKVEFWRYEKLQVNLIIISVLGAFFACFAYLFLVAKFHLGASVLAGLYGIYSAIPVRRKVAADMKYYGLKDEE